MDSCLNKEFVINSLPAYLRTEYEKMIESIQDFEFPNIQNHFDFEIVRFIRKVTGLVEKLRRSMPFDNSLQVISSEILKSSIVTKLKKLDFEVDLF